MFSLRKDTYNVHSETAILQNSLTFKVGQVIIPVTGTTTNHVVTNATSAVAGDKYVLGVITGFCKNNGDVIGGGQDPANTPNELTTGATNVATVKYRAVYIPIHKHMIWEATMSGARGTTTASDLNYTYFNLSDCDTVDETSVQPIEGTSVPLQVQIVEESPTSTSKAYVRFHKTLYER
jgi:hypothetical protein